MKKQFERFRPNEYPGSADKYLFKLIAELSFEISRLELQYFSSALKLEKNQKFVMANLLVEFAEDLHNDIGLWESIECYNRSLFKSPLPLFVDSDYIFENCFDANRIKFFIHSIFYEFKDTLILSPQHVDLNLLANGVSNFLTKKFAAVRKDSGIKKMLEEPNEFGWDFKSKLVWIGMNSYLFRLTCNRYVKEKNKGKLEIAIIDDFVCQGSTLWSGLTVAEILGKAVGLPEKTLNDVKSWHERLLAFYRVISMKNSILELENTIINQVFTVQLDKGQSVFEIDEIVFGSIVPFGEHYYWSGVQHRLGKVDSESLTQVVSGFRSKSTKAVYRYDKVLLSKALEDVKVHYSEFVSFFNDNLVSFNDGITMAAAMQKLYTLQNNNLKQKQFEKDGKQNDLRNSVPTMNFPDELLNAENGIGVYFNEGFGTEMMIGFDAVKSGFMKKGIDLTRDENEAIREFICSESISPEFVHKLIGERSEQSIASAFLIKNDLNSIEYLLHRYKGHFYRNRYPEISFM